MRKKTTEEPMIDQLNRDLHPEWAALQTERLDLEVKISEEGAEPWRLEQELRDCEERHRFRQGAFLRGEAVDRDPFEFEEEVLEPLRQRVLEAKKTHEQRLRRRSELDRLQDALAAEATEVIGGYARRLHQVAVRKMAVALRMLAEANEEGQRIIELGGEALWYRRRVGSRTRIVLHCHPLTYPGIGSLSNSNSGVRRWLQEARQHGYDLGD